MSKKEVNVDKLNIAAIEEKMKMMSAATANKLGETNKTKMSAATAKKLCETNKTKTKKDKK